MSLSKEARIGLLVTAAVIIFFAGFYYLKGTSILSRENTYTCFYPNVQGLQASANVQVRGLNVGRVSKIQLVDNQGVKVTISVNKDVEVTKGTIAKLTSSDLLGTKIISLDLGSSKEELVSGTQLQTAAEGGLLDNVSSQVGPLLKDVRTVVATLDTVLVGVNNIVNVQNQKALSNSIASLNKTTQNFASLSASLNQETGEINHIIHNANSITANLANSNDRIDSILNNAEVTTRHLKNAPIQETVTQIQDAATQLKEVIAKINNNQGSLGKLVNDKQLYDNLTNSLNTLNSLMGDIQEHPTRYINVTIFGKKKP